MEEGTWLGLLVPCVLAAASAPAPHISQTLFSPQHGGESRQEGPSTKSPQHQGFNASPKTRNAALCLHVCPPILPGGTQGCCLALGTPSTSCCCSSTRTRRGHVGTGTHLGQTPHPAARQETPLSPREGKWGLSHPEHPVTTQRMRQGPGLTCACGSCGSEREGDTGIRLPLLRGHGGLQTPKGLPSTLLTPQQRQEGATARVTPCRARGSTPQGFTMRKV